MRHRCKKGKLNVESSHRNALMRNMAVSLIEHGCIKVSLAGAKVLRRYIESLITFVNTKSSNESIFVIRYLLPKVAGNILITKKLISLSGKYVKRPGGYTRITKCGYRNNDRMPLAFISFV